MSLFFGTIVVSFFLCVVIMAFVPALSTAVGGRALKSSVCMSSGDSVKELGICRSIDSI